MAKSGKVTLQEQYEAATGKRNTYIFLTVLFAVFPIAGYLLENGPVVPVGKTLLYLIPNFGAYGLAGVLGAYLLFAVIAGFCVIISCIKTRGFIGGIVWGLISFVIILGVATGLIEVLYPFSDKIAVWASENISAKPIPGISKTFGIAILCSLVYDVPFLLFMVNAVRSFRKAAVLKKPALEEISATEARKKQAAEDQKQLARERKEREDEKHREYERFILEQDKARKANAAGLGEYSFFQGCMTQEQLKFRYDQLIAIYAVDGSGDPALAEVIRNQYEAIKQELEK